MYESLNKNFIDIDRLTIHAQAAKTFKNEPKKLKQQKYDIEFNNLNISIDDSQAVNEKKLNEILKQAKINNNENEKLKNLIRNNTWSFNHKIRRYLWKCLLEITNFDLIKVENEYNSDINQIFGHSRELNINLPNFLQNEYNHFNYYYLNQLGKEAVTRIICVYAYRYPDITYSPSLVSICSLLLHYMNEYEVYVAIGNLFAMKDYLVETRSSWDINKMVFIRLLRSFSRSSYDALQKYSNEPLDLLLNDWYWWIFDDLSFDYQIKIMDCYLIEGQKILFRVSLALMQLFCKKNFKNENIKITKDLIKEYCRLSSVPLEKLLKMSFSIRNLKRSTIRELYAKEKVKLALSIATNDVNKLNDSNNNNRNYESHNISVNTQNLQKSILNHSQIHLLWNWIPQRLSVFSPHIEYTSQENGFSLNTLYNVLDELEYCIIIIKTCNNEIFGAFCSGEWNERHHTNKYFGNGETFLFKLQPKTSVYKWIGTQKRAINIQPNQELFLRATKTQLSIGGGNGDGILINSNLTSGYTSKCDTFENEPLSNTSDFQIAIIEVITFI